MQDLQPHDLSRDLSRDLILEATQSSPAVSCSRSDGLIRMKGESYPENSFDLYRGILAWLESYLQESEQPLRLELELNDLNTSSVRAMIEVFDQLQAAAEGGREVVVNWYDDPRNPRAAELGEEFREDYTFPFSILALDS